MEGLTFLADVNKITFIRVPEACDMWIIKKTWQGLRTTSRLQSYSLLHLQPKINLEKKKPTF